MNTIIPGGGKCPIFHITQQLGPTGYIISNKYKWC